MNYLYIGLMNSIHFLPRCLMLGVALLVSPLCDAQSSQEKPEASLCRAVFNHTLPSLKENLQFELQVSHEPELAIEHYVDLMRRTFVGQALTKSVSGQSRALPADPKQLQPLQESCYQHFTQANFPDNPALKINRNTVFDIDNRIDGSLVEMVGPDRRVPVMAAISLRKELPEKFLSGVSLERIVQQKGGVNLLFSTDAAAASQFQTDSGRNLVFSDLCKVMTSHLTPQVASLVTFTLITPQDSNLGVLEAKNCQNKESK